MSQSTEDVQALKQQIEALQTENDRLKRGVYKPAGPKPPVSPSARGGEAKVDDQEFKASELLKKKALTVVVFGASGHLAHTKTYPALCALFNRVQSKEELAQHERHPTRPPISPNKRAPSDPAEDSSAETQRKAEAKSTLTAHSDTQGTIGLLPDHVSIVGFARSKSSDADFRASLGKKLKVPEDLKNKFLERCSYFAGDYDDDNAYVKLDAALKEVEASRGGPDANRVFYFAIPPQIFPIASKHIRKSAFSTTGWNRVVIEKPFGKDSATSRELSQQILSCFTEDQVYRIDHYLGKEMVQNLMTLRFANIVFEPVWNHHYINSVLITFKEPQGIEGRGQYFDEYGIIRDVMQNHLMQMLSLVAMEPPVTLDAEDSRNEKVKVLRAIEPIRPEDIVIGQYTGDEAKGIAGYQEDPTVPKGSIAPTFAAAVLRIRNPRWEGVPFILKCGKGIDSKKAEVRVQFKHFPGNFFGGSELPVNELVMRVQPDEAIYLKMNAKSPGLTETVEQTELNLTYQSRFKVKDLPDAYERLILDVLRGDHRLFVRDDELQHAWDIFTPVLHHFEKNKIKPLPYKIGSRGPAEADELISNAGYKRYEGYEWVSPDK